MNFAQPGWLLLLLLLPCIGVASLLSVRLKRSRWGVFYADRLRANLLRQSSAFPQWVAFILLLIASATAITALARPRADAGIKTEKTHGRNVMIALDISKSMQVDDVKPNRLTQAKVLITELLEAMPNEKIGLIGFAGTPNTFAPLTNDHTALTDTLAQIDENWAPLGGTDLSAAVELATQTLKKTGQKNNALIILSDGEEVRDDADRSEIETMAANAERSGVYIAAIGVGTENGGFVPDKNFPNGQMVDRSGRPVISRLQTEVLRKLAEKTKGCFAVAGSGLDIATLVKSLVSQMDAFETEGRQRRISIEFYQWLMLPTVLLIILSIIAATRWKGLQTAVFAWGLLCICPRVHASDLSEAQDLLKNQRYAEAQKSYRQLAQDAHANESKAHFSLGEGIAAYRAGDYREARSAFSLALESSDTDMLGNAHLSMGNTLFQLGWKGLTTSTYPTAPSEVPDLDRFTEIVKETLAKLSQEDASDTGDSNGFLQITSLISNWTDAVRHYESASRHIATDPAPANNRSLTLTYLRRLEELIKEEKKQAEQSMPQAGPGPPAEGEEEGEGDGESDAEGKGKNGKSKNPKNKGKKPDGSDHEGPGKKKKDPQSGDSDLDKDGDNPNESPKERASRILKENADSEKGPVSPGRRDFDSAQKDW
jgi:Ca-activated chloride channel homolog